MQHLTPAQLRGQLIQELASWPTMGERAQRQLLVEGAGYSDLVPEIDWTGSAVAFVVRLLELIGRADGSAAADFLASLADTAAIGKDRRATLLSLHAELIRLDEASRHGVLVAGRRGSLDAEFRRSTEREIKELGSKYIPDLYFMLSGGFEAGPREDQPAVPHGRAPAG